MTKNEIHKQVLTEFTEKPEFMFYHVLLRRLGGHEHMQALGIPAYRVHHGHHSILSSFRKAD